MVKIVKDAAYKQVADDIRDGITSPDHPRLRPADMLPSEAELKTEY